MPPLSPFALVFVLGIQMGGGADSHAFEYEFGATTNECGKGAFYICPTVLSPNSEAKIHLPPNHPSGLAVRTPSGEWIYIVEPGGRSTALPGFPGRSKLSFQVSRLSGLRWQEGRKIEVPIFRESGRYIFYLADNMDTEPENTFSIAVAVLFTGNDK